MRFFIFGEYSLKLVKWDEYDALLIKLYNDISLRDFDEIVAIGRGGSIIGAYLAEKIGLPTFNPIFLRHVGRGAERKIVAPDIDKIKSLSGEILVVDDWQVEGSAMKFVTDLIPNAASITTMVMFSRKRSDFKPDFVGEYVEEGEREIVFPYNPLG